LPRLTTIYPSLPPNTWDYKHEAPHSALEFSLSAFMEWSCNWSTSNPLLAEGCGLIQICRCPLSLSFLWLSTSRKEDRSQAGQFTCLLAVPPGGLELRA
jgi:hypothetical protein